MLHAIPPTKGTPIVAIQTAQDTKRWNAAKDLEASFLAEMLRHTGFKSDSSAFSGGAGEDHFQSFLVREQAKKLVDSGGIGLAESLFEALKARANG